MDRAFLTAPPGRQRHLCGAVNAYDRPLIVKSAILLGHTSLIESSSRTHFPFPFCFFENVRAISQFHFHEGLVFLEMVKSGFPDGDGPGSVSAHMFEHRGLSLPQASQQTVLRTG